MKKSYRKSVSLFGAVLAVCAVAAPMASGANWSPVGMTRVLSSADLAFTSGAPPATIGWRCATTEFHVTIASAQAMEILGGSFQNCTGLFALNGCTLTTTPTNFPWTATAVTTDNIQIHGIDVDIRFEHHPIDGPCSISTTQQARLTGTLSGGSFDPSAMGTNRRITLFHDSLTLHDFLVGGTAQAFVTGTLLDPTGTLNVSM